MKLRLINQLKAHSFNRFAPAIDFMDSSPPEAVHFPFNPLLLMDLLIPFSSSINGDLELLFSLRTMEKNIEGIERVLIVGDHPAWNFNPEYVKVMPMENLYREKHFKDRNILNKILVGLNHVQAPVICADDDMFQLATTSVDLITAYHKGTVWLRADHGDYAKTENNTKSLFSKQINNYNTHSPYKIWNASEFKEALTKNIDWTNPYGYTIKGVYYNRISHPGEFYHRDLKINGSYSKDKLDEIITGGLRYFSCNDTSWKYGVHAWLKERFPNKSKYEL